MVRLPQNLTLGLVALGVVIVVGSIGFMLIGDLSFSDAWYSTFITISSLGYAEIGGPYEGLTRVWVVLVILGGTGAALYTATGFVRYAIEDVVGSNHRRKRRMKRNIEQLSDHVIVCGFGRVGRTAWEALERDNVPSVVVERDPDVAEQAESAGALVVEGNATRDGVLGAAGVERARSVVAAVASPSENLVITLSARDKNPDLRVAARAIDLETERKLSLAGASSVVTPELVGGERIAALAVEPGLADFLDAVVHNTKFDFRIKQFEITETSPFIGRSLRELDLRRDTGAMVIGVSHPDREVRINPDPTQKFQVGDILIGLGATPDLDRLERLVAGE